MAKTPEELLANDASSVGDVEEIRDLSAEEIAEAEDTQSETDAYTDADARVEAIELDNDAKDQLVAESQEISDEVIDADEHDRG